MVWKITLWNEKIINAGGKVFRFAFQQMDAFNLLITGCSHFHRSTI